MSHSCCQPCPDLPMGTQPSSSVCSVLSLSSHAFTVLHLLRLLTIPHDLRWILITAAALLMLPLCPVSSLPLLRLGDGGLQSFSLREAGDMWWMSRNSRRIPSCLREQQRQRRCWRLTGAPRAPAEISGVPSLSFNSHSTTSADEQLCEGATVSGAPLRRDLSLAHLLFQDKVGLSGLCCLRITSSDHGMCSALVALYSSFE